MGSGSFTRRLPTLPPSSCWTLLATPLPSNAVNPQRPVKQLEYSSPSLAPWSLSSTTSASKLIALPMPLPLATSPRTLPGLASPPCCGPSLSYSLPVTSFSEPQSLQITWKLYRGLLPKLGMVRSFPLPLWHAPSSLYGLALPSILWEQGIAALHLLLEVGNGPSMAGSLLHTLVEQAQLEVGSLTPFYQLPFQQYGFLLTNCWLKSVWSFLSSAQLCLQSSSGSSLHLQREHDTYLMDHLVSTAAFTPATLQSFNCCRLYMRCLSLADLSTGKGDCLHPPFYTRFPPASQQFPLAC